MDKIGKYEVVRKIGQGGFGVVYEGRDPLIKRRVAIKTCSAEDEEIRRRFFREGEIAGNLQHRHVVTVFDLGVMPDGVPFLVQEYLPGEDLAHKIKRKDALDEYTKLSYLAQVAEGLEYAHAQGVVHRDIKPANIRILDDDSVKIMDFGIAKLASAETQLTHTGMAMGTAGYLPPEQIRGEKVDLRADIFSYGVLAYELLAGRRPFQADNMSAVLFQIIGQEPPPLISVWPACPQALDTLVKKCLAKSPTDRYSSFTPLLAALRPIRDSVKGLTVPLPAVPTDTPTQVIPTARTAVEMETLRSLEKRLRDSVESGDLTAAELELTLARKRHGDSQAFSQVMDPLMARIAEIRREWEEKRQRSERLTGLVERARSLRAEGNLDEARHALTAALDLDARNEEVQALLRSLDEAIEKKRHEEREREATKAAAGRIEALVRDGQVERAEEALGEALRRHGEREPLVAARRLLQQKKVELREAAVRERLSNAQALEAAGKLGEAQEVLREALQIQPDNQEIKKYLARITASLQKQLEEERRVRSIAAAAAAIEQALGKGDLRASADLLGRHERELGAEPFRALRQRHKDAEKQARETVRVPTVPPPAPPAPRSTPVAPPPVVHRPSEPAAAPAPSRPVAMWVGLAALALLLVLGAGGYFLFRGGASKDEVAVVPTPVPPSVEPTVKPSPVTEPSATAPPAVVAAGNGTLVLDALPWAEVVEVVDASGKKWPLKGPNYTPFALSLPAGEYTVTFKNPARTTPITRKARVMAAGNEILLAEFRKVDAADYLKKAGL